jgi:ubiquinone/menaquinone biosynthesis C-methylase UbiE
MEEDYSIESRHRRQFQEAAKKYQLDEEITLQRKHGLERRMAAFFRLFDRAVSSPKKVLDLGCGPGTYPRLLTRQGHEVVGVDYSEAVIGRAVEKSGGLGEEYLVADVRYLPFTPGSFDVLVCIGLLQSLSPPSIPKVIAEMKRVLSDSGLLFLIARNGLSLKVISQRLRDRPAESSRRQVRMYSYSPYQIKKLLQEEGFKRCEIHSVFIFPEKYTFLEPVFDKLGDLSRIALPMAHSFLIEADLAG